MFIIKLKIAHTIKHGVLGWDKYLFGSTDYVHNKLCQLYNKKVSGSGRYIAGANLQRMGLGITRLVKTIPDFCLQRVIPWPIDRQSALEPHQRLAWVNHHTAVRIACR